MIRTLSLTLSLAALIGGAANLSAATTAPAATPAAHGHSHGKMEDLGSVALAGGKVSVEYEAKGAFVPGKETVLEVEVEPATPAPKAVRVWIGIESGKGSAKALGTPEPKHPGDYDVHVEVPNPLPADAAVWVEIEPAAGAATRASIALPAKKP